jgi:hypothetical protein
MYLAAFGCILATARVARCVWVLENIIKLVSQPSKRLPPPSSAAGGDHAESQGS